MLKVVDIVFWMLNRIKEDNELVVDIVIKVSIINVIWWIMLNYCEWKNNY